MSLTAGTIEDSHIQRHLLAMSTDAACLTRIGRVDSHVVPASFFRFAGQFAEKLRPGGIGNAFGETMVVGHAVDVQVFYSNHAVVIDDLAAFLVREVVASEGNPFMHASHNFAMLATLGCVFGEFAMLALRLSQRLLFLAKEARVLNLCAIRESRERLESDINPYLGGKFRQSLRFAFNRKRNIPLARRRTMHRTRFEFPLDGSVIDHLDRTHFGEAHPLIMGDAKAALGKGEGVIAVHPSEPRGAWFLSGFAASEEGFEGQINTYRNILENLRMDLPQRGTSLFQDRKGFLLLIEREAFAFLLIGCLTTFKQVVIEPTALFKRLVELLHLLLAWKNPILKRFTHAYMVAQTGQECKREATPSLPQTRNAFHPLLGRQGLSTDLRGKSVA